MNIHNGWRRGALAVAVATLAACASPDPEPGALIADPYERANREFHAFNVGVDQVLLRPTAYVYDAVTPALFQHMLSNFVDHLRLPVIFVNNVLQVDPDAALETAGRFGVNTLVGAGGLLDPATEFGLPYRDTDFGLTLAEWGADEGVYRVLPFFGPSTDRDAVGLAGNFVINPLTYVTFGDGSGQTLAAVGQIAGPIIVGRSENFALIDELFYNTEDSYVATRSAFVQSRRAQVNDGVVDTEALPDIYAE
jgi:phospholipid-binding lipoprotein MlaA